MGLHGLPCFRPHGDACLAGKARHCNEEAALHPDDRASRALDIYLASDFVAAARLGLCRVLRHHGGHLALRESPLADKGGEAGPHDASPGQWRPADRQLPPRIIPIPWVVWCWWSASKGDWLWVEYLVGCAAFPLPLLLNLLWFSLIMRAALARLCPDRGETRPPSNKEE